MSAISKDKLIYDSSTPSDGDSVAAFLRASAALTSTTVGGDEALDINIVQSVSLVVTATDLDIRDLAFATDKVDVSGSSVSVTQGTSPWVVGDGGGSLTVDGTVTANAGTGFPFFAEDSAHSSGATGAFVLGVRNDAAAALTSADGDYSPMATDSAGRMGIADLGGSITVDAVDLDIRNLAAATDSVAAWTKDGAGTSITSTTAGAKQALDVNIAASDITFNVDVVNSSEYAEDAAHSSGAIGNFVLAVRNDALASLTSADGDYSPFAVSSAGELFTKASAPNSSLGTGQKQVSTSALLVAASSGRKRILVQNLGSKAVYLGPSGVTAAAGGDNSTDGIRVAAGGNVELDIGPALALHAVAESGTQAVRYMQVA